MGGTHRPFHRLTNESMVPDDGADLCRRGAAGALPSVARSSCADRGGGTTSSGVSAAIRSHSDLLEVVGRASPPGAPGPVEPIGVGHDRPTAANDRSETANLRRLTTR